MSEEPENKFEEKNVKEPEAVFCSCCGTFIGTLDDLDVCPVCGQNLLGSDGEQ